MFIILYPKNILIYYIFTTEIPLRQTITDISEWERGSKYPLLFDIFSEKQLQAY